MNFGMQYFWSSRTNKFVIFCIVLSIQIKFLKFHICHYRIYPMLWTQLKLQRNSICMLCETALGIFRYVWCYIDAFFHSCPLLLLLWHSCFSITALAFLLFYYCSGSMKNVLNFEYYSFSLKIMFHIHGRQPAFNGPKWKKLCTPYKV